MAEFAVHHATAEPAAGHGRLLLTVEEAAVVIGVGRSFMYQLIASGEIKTVLVGRLRRIRPTDLEAFVGQL